MTTTIRRATVCFIKTQDKILLALIEYGPDKRIWNGIGGWAEIGESVEEGVVREVSEETYIILDKNSLTKVVEDYGEIHLNVFIATAWTGEIKIKEPSLKELKWFAPDQIPYSQMFPGVETWLPKVLDGKLLKYMNGQLVEVGKF
ncbi:MAG: hypothetical protein RI947_524 [Candidatus Parcubacteria bacterium]|jgi:8-oxo-dGTP diphosphatase